MTRKGGTPRWRRLPDDRRAAILHAALTEFDLKGLEAARMDDIAAAAGISKGTVYRYFPDKMQLFSESIADSVRSALTPFERTIGRDPEAAVRRLWLLVADTRFTAAYRLSLSHSTRKADDAVGTLIEDSVVKPLALMLGQSEREYTLSQDEALIRARLAVATLLGASLLSLTSPESLFSRIAFLLRACELVAPSPQADGF